MMYNTVERKKKKIRNKNNKTTRTWRFTNADDPNTSRINPSAPPRRSRYPKAPPNTFITRTSSPRRRPPVPR